MSIRLESITFNHDPDSARTDAINLRRNMTTFLPVPEWQRGISFRAEDSQAAYALEETRNRTLTIRVRLSRIDPGLRSVEVRAIPEAAASPLPVFGWPVWPIGYDPSAYWYYSTQYYLSLVDYLFGSGSRPSDNVLGSVKARQVTFTSNQASKQEMFVLENPQLWDRGAGIHELAWQWQYRTAPNRPWTNFASTRHKIYTILSMPTAPWKQLPYHPSNTLLPWTEVLEYACDWAFGTKTPDEAAAGITRSVYSMGPASLIYDCVLGGTSQYTDLVFPYFYCSEFLEHLKGGLGRGGLINCTDCATIVSTFANILGCDLWQSRMFTGFLVFALNPIRAIGFPEWQTACGWPGFSMHEVAWKGGCTSNDEVFDACLEVDGGADPTRPPHTPLLPVNMRFGHPGEGLYRDRLTAPRDNAREICEPRPESRQRRLVR